MFFLLLRMVVHSKINSCLKRSIQLLVLWFTVSIYSALQINVIMTTIMLWAEAEISSNTEQILQDQNGMQVQS